MIQNETLFLGECPIVRPEGIYYGGRKVISLGLRGIGLGALERRNPLPAGHYWVDVFDQDSAAFTNWLQANKSSVIVKTTEHYDANGGGPARDWYLFDVSTPIPWDGPGFPTIAAPNVTTSEDTAQRPDPEKDPLDRIDPAAGLDQFQKDVITVVKAVAIGGVVIGVVVVGVSLLKKTPQRAPQSSFP